MLRSEHAKANIFGTRMTKLPFMIGLSLIDFKQLLVDSGSIVQCATCDNFFSRGRFGALLCNYSQDPKVPLPKFKSPAVHKYFLPHSHAGQAVVFDIWLAGDLTVGNTTL